MLTPREIIGQAWAITTTEKPLKRWGFFGAFFEILLDVKLLVYQVYFIYRYFEGESGGLFDIEIFLYKSMPPTVFWTIIVLFILLVIVELFVPSLAEGAMIGLTAKAHNKEPVEGGFILGLYNFFPILAVHEVFVFSSVSIFVTAVSVILRYGEGLKYPMLAVATFIWVISNVIKFFSSFTEPGIVVQKLGVFEAGAKSVKLIFSYVPHVMFLMLLLVVISIRIFINTIIITLLPAIIMGGGVLLTYVLSPVMSFFIAAIFGLVLTFIAAYFFAYLHIFRQAVWTVMYVELIKQKELDKIG